MSRPQASPSGGGTGRAPAAPAAPAAGEFRAVLPAQALPAGQVRRVVVDGRPIALWNTGSAILATDDTCTHEKASLSEGDFDPGAEQVACPRHGARFDLRSGRALTLPAYKPLRTYPVRVEGGQIQIRLA